MFFIDFFFLENLNGFVFKVNTEMKENNNDLPMYCWHSHRHWLNKVQYTFRRRIIVFAAHAPTHDSQRTSCIAHTPCAILLVLPANLPFEVSTVLNLSELFPHLSFPVCQFSMYRALHPFGEVRLTNLPLSPRYPLPRRPPTLLFRRPPTLLLRRPPTLLLSRPPEQGSGR